MDRYEDEEAAEKAAEIAQKLAAEKKEVDDTWKDLVKNVLSNIRIDPKYAGKKYEFFVKYEGEVTADQIKALQQSNFGICFKQFIRLWKELPETRDKAELYEVADLFKKLSSVTESPFWT